MPVFFASVGIPLLEAISMGKTRPVSPTTELNSAKFLNSEKSHILGENLFVAVPLNRLGHFVAVKLW